ncbi:hypothetical protein BN424_1378 [Carnobacterium maltaromaticum LMA28]|uniref:Uncharacterized protein n=1 Tax=Carnobacterium maltaromaticum LMA28 TaxID=1234679 RepID=K8E3L1_CARML|nr:hypothetical protein BN424_1378 [Carnobacterium maltaromaticum LMA28]
MKKIFNSIKMEFRGVIYFEGTVEVSTLKRVVLVVLKK